MDVSVFISIVLFYKRSLLSLLLTKEVSLMWKGCLHQTLLSSARTLMIDLLWRDSLEQFTCGRAAPDPVPCGQSSASSETKRKYGSF